MRLNGRALSRHNLPDQVVAVEIQNLSSGISGKLGRKQQMNRTRKCQLIKQGVSYEQMLRIKVCI